MVVELATRWAAQEAAAYHTDSFHGSLRVDETNHSQPHKIAGGRKDLQRIFCGNRINSDVENQCYFLREG
eukprot:scaffold13708_cov88-Skeletonema_marinoi.AAC.1